VPCIAHALPCCIHISLYYLTNEKYVIRSWSITHKHALMISNELIYEMNIALREGYWLTFVCEFDNIDVALSFIALLVNWCNSRLPPLTGNSYLNKTELMSLRISDRNISPLLESVNLIVTWRVIQFSNFALACWTWNGLNSGANSSTDSYLLNITTLHT
jgi:hypothetical protein